MPRPSTRIIIPSLRASFCPLRSPPRTFFTSATRTPLRPAPNPRTAANTTTARPCAPTITSTVQPETQLPAARSVTPPQARGLSSMASDEDYMAFLNKANRDAEQGRAVGAAAAQQQGQRQAFKALDEGAQVPRVIEDAIRGGKVYVSDADEPFDGVSLAWSGEGGLPDEETFARLIGHWDAPNAEIEIMDPTDWDRHDQYSDIVDAVSEATKGNDVRVYRVPRDKRSRVEYWVVSRDDAGGRLVGVKALGVES